MERYITAEERDLLMKNCFSRIYERYIKGSSPADELVFCEIYSNIVSDLEQCLGDYDSVLRYMKVKIFVLTEEYEAQPVHFTQEFSVFHFLNSELDSVAEMFSTEKTQETDKTSYWISFYFFVKCLVIVVSGADEAQINRIQRAFDRLCSSCRYL